MRLVLVAALALSSASFAQNTSGEQKRKAPVSEVKFGEGDDILGGTVGPDGQVVQGDQRKVFPSMIRVRDNFADKLRQSVNALP
jgi:hypothetical protein